MPPQPLCHSNDVRRMMLAIRVGRYHAAAAREVNQRVVHPGFERRAFSQVDRVVEQVYSVEAANSLKTTCGFVPAAVIHYYDGAHFQAQQSVDQRLERLSGLISRDQDRRIGTGCNLSCALLIE